MNAFQPMPDLDPDQYDALRGDIADRGVLVPIVVDQHGRVLDGNNRLRIATELGIECPRDVRRVADDQEALDLAVTLNCARRHLTQSQKRELIRTELIRKDFADSDRAVSRRVGCSPTTVGTVRGELRAEAEERCAAIRQTMRENADNLLKAAVDLLVAGADMDELIGRAVEAKETATTVVRAAGDDAFAQVGPLIDFYVYTCLANDLSDLAEDLAEAGWSRATLTLPESELKSLTAALFPVSRLDTASVGVAR